MYLLFETYESANQRNLQAITDLGWQNPENPTRIIWEEIECTEGTYQGKWALDVLDGKYLTPEELSECVNNIYDEQGNLI